MEYELQRRALKLIKEQHKALTQQTEYNNQQRQSNDWLNDSVFFGAASDFNVKKFTSNSNVRFICVYVILQKVVQL